MNDICPCKYNFFVDCEKQDKCYKCGWNPAVQRERIQEFLKKEEQKNE